MYKFAEWRQPDFGRIVWYQVNVHVPDSMITGSLIQTANWFSGDSGITFSSQMCEYSVWSGPGWVELWCPVWNDRFLLHEHASATSGHRLIYIIWEGSI